jgi:hypothetical protein
VLVLAGVPALAMAQQGYAPYPNPGWQGGPNAMRSAPPAGYAQQDAYGQQDYGAQDPGAGAATYPSAGYGGAGYGPAQPQAPLNVQQLEQLVAPIALYPDTLVAQVLAAATYPAQVVEADHWRQAQGYASADQIVYGADAQSWDPSVKGLTAFPQVLAELDQNLQWTIALGNAYYNQPQDVLDVVQVMRQRAQAAGSLQSSPQEAVTYNAGYIQLAPPDPQVVYVPTYDPWSAYGEPVSPYPGFSLLGVLGRVGSFLGSSILQYGPGIAMTAFNHSPFGLLQWGLNWLEHALLFHQSPYSSSSTSLADWGLPHGGPRAFGRPTGNYPRTVAGGQRPEGYGRGYEPRNGYRDDKGYGQANSFTHLPGQRFEPSPLRNPVRAATPMLDGRGQQNGYRGYEPPSGRNGGPAQAWNRPQPMQSRPMQTGPQQPVQRAFSSVPDGGRGYERGYGQGYGQGYAARPGFDGRTGLENRPGMNYGNPGGNNRVLQAYRAPAPTFGNRDGERMQGREFGGRAFDGRDGRESRESRGFESHSKPPKMPKAEKSFKAEKVPKAEHGHGGGLFGGRGGGHHR